jgi:hypothetical protein
MSRTPFVSSLKLATPDQLLGLLDSLIKRNPTPAGPNTENVNNVARQPITGIRKLAAIGAINRPKLAAPIFIPRALRS